MNIQKAWGNDYTLYCLYDGKAENRQCMSASITLLWWRKGNHEKKNAIHTAIFQKQKTPIVILPPVKKFNSPDVNEPLKLLHHKTLKETYSLTVSTCQAINAKQIIFTIQGIDRESETTTIDISKWQAVRNNSYNTTRSSGTPIIVSCQTTKQNTEQYPSCQTTINYCGDNSKNDASLLTKRDWGRFEETGRDVNNIYLWNTLTDNYETCDDKNDQNCLACSTKAHCESITNITQDQVKIWQENITIKDIQCTRGPENANPLVSDPQPQIIINNSIIPLNEEQISNYTIQNNNVIWPNIAFSKHYRNPWNTIQVQCLFNNTANKQCKTTIEIPAICKEIKVWPKQIQKSHNMFILEPIVCNYDQKDLEHSLFIEYWQNNTWKTRKTDTQNYIKSSQYRATLGTLNGDKYIIYDDELPTKHRKTQIFLFTQQNTNKCLHTRNRNSNTSSTAKRATIRTKSTKLPRYRHKHRFQRVRRIHRISMTYHIQISNYSG